MSSPIQFLHRRPPKEETDACNPLYLDSLQVLVLDPGPVTRPQEPHIQGLIDSWAARGSWKVLASMIFSSFMVKETILKSCCSTSLAPDCGMAVQCGHAVWLCGTIEALGSAWRSLALGPSHSTKLTAALELELFLGFVVLIRGIMALG